MDALLCFADCQPLSADSLGKCLGWSAVGPDPPPQLSGSPASAVRISHLSCPDPPPQLSGPLLSCPDPPPQLSGSPLSCPDPPPQLSGSPPQLSGSPTPAVRIPTSAVRIPVSAVRIPSCSSGGGVCRQWIDLAICAVPDGLVGQAGRTRTDRRHRRPADARRINRNDLIGPGAVAAWSARTDFIWPGIEPGLALEVNGGWRPSLASAAGWGARRCRQWGGLSSQWERSVRAPSRPNLPRRYPSRLALPCPALPCPALPCPALSCLA